MADQFDAFQKEVEEDLQRERMLKLWKEYGTYIIAGCVAIVLGVAGYKYNEARQITASEAASKSFVDGVKALAAGKDKAADAKALAAVASRGDTYGTLAKLRLAAADAAAGETAKALAAFDAIAKSSGGDPLLAQYARLQTAMLTIDTAPWTDIQNRVNDLTVDSSPWRHQAREVIALAAFKAGKIDEAKALFTKLVADPTTPRSIGERVGIVLAEIAQGELAKTVPAQPAAKPADAPAQKPGAVETKPAAGDAPKKK